MGNQNQILVLFAHPALEKSRVNRQLIRAISGMQSVTIHDLYERYPNFHINVKAEQELLLSHDIIVFQHPFYWYSGPSILKEWQDLVLEYGFAYGHKGNALQGKKVLSAVTTGGSKQAYCQQGHNRFTMRELLTPFEQTARLCGMDYLPPFVIHGTHKLKDSAEIAIHVDHYRQVITALRDDTAPWEQMEHYKYFNEIVGQKIPEEVAHHAS